jgi:SpoVK/Ycf46/Vps4 family AAA+-type ATPase
VKRDVVRELIRAHYQNDERGFKATALRIAALEKGDTIKREIEGFANQPRLVLMKGEGGDMTAPVKAVAEDELVLDAGVRGALTAIAAEHRSVPALLARGLAPRSRLLFYGPPGNGKTSAAALLSGLIGLSCYAVSLPGIVGSHLGVTAANLAKLFPALSAGVCLVLDEIDSIGSQRGGGNSGSDREFNHTVNSLLSLLDRTAGGLLIATTNRPELLDPALRRRFDLELAFPAPSDANRRELRDRLCEGHGVLDPSKVYIGECCSFDDVTKAVRDVARQEAVEEAARALEAVGG